MRSSVDNILVVDRAPYGREGPWLTYARMDTLRSPKDYTGPDLDIPSLTYQAWHIAKYGAKSWSELDLIPRGHWADYLLWVRQMTNVPVSNETDVADISPSDGLLAVQVKNAAGETEQLFTRKVVLATGQDGTGHWWMPDEIAALPERFRAHTADIIDFERLRGKTIAVLGTGASAFDNAAVALESGAAAVTLFCRRERPQVIQPYRWLTFRGFLRHLSDLEDAWRWRFMRHILALREGFPQATYDRCARHDNFRLLTGAPWTSVRLANDQVEISTPRGLHRADFIISGTGVEMDFSRRPELHNFAGNIAQWSDRYEPPSEERDDRLGRFPYLDEDFAFVEKTEGLTPWIKDIHLFAIGSTMSFGPSGSSINAMTTILPKLVAAITKGLFCADVESHWDSLQAYDEPQAIVPQEEQ